MLMDWPYLVGLYRLDQRVTGILACGAHLAEEAKAYAELDVPVTWIEGNPELLPEIRANLEPYPKQRVIGALLSDVDGAEATLHVTGPYRGSSSLLEFGTHTTHDPVTRFTHHLALPTRTIDSLVAEHAIEGVNMVCLDLQGMEGPVLRGAIGLLPSVEFLMTEINDRDVYVGATRVWELDEMLARFGLRRVKTCWVEDQGWGDGFWRRRL